MAAIRQKDAVSEYTRLSAGQENNASGLKVGTVAAMAAAVAGAILGWQNTKVSSSSNLRPAVMEFGEEQPIAMFYSTGHRATGRRPMEAHNLLDRMGRLVRSNVTWVVQQLEDPEKVIEQAVTDMQADLVKVRQAYSEILATQKRAEVKQKQAAEIVAQWQKRAELALTKGDEELAREALRRKNAEQKVLDGLTTQIAQSEPIAQNLLNSMKQLEGKLDEAKANKAQLIARSKSAKAQKQVSDMLTGLDTGSAMAAFDRMEEKVEALEAQADVAGILAEGTTLDKQFKALEGGSVVDDELAQLKRQLQGPKTPEPVYLPPSRDEDDEIEKIRRQLRQ